MFLLLAWFAASWTAFVPAAEAGSITLNWDRNYESSLAGYRVYWRTDGSSTISSLNAGLATSVTVPNLPTGVVYYLAVAAYSRDGLESGPLSWVRYGLGVNTPPTANSVSVAVAKNGSLPLVLQGSDPDGTAVTFALRTAPAHGTVTGTPPNVAYTPYVGYVGADSFTFTTKDQALYSAPATVGIQVIANAPPVASPASVSVPEASSVAITLRGTDPEAAALTYTVTVPPSHGTLQGAVPNVRYVPTLGYAGPDSFSFTVRDALSTSAPATVTITVTPINHRPTAMGGAWTLDEDTSQSFAVVASDSDGEPLTYAVAALPAHGTLTGTLPRVTYRPAANFFGEDCFKYTVSDGRLTSAVAVVYFTVSPVNDAPVASPLTVSTVAGQSISVILAATDPDGGSVASYSVVASPTKGTLSGTAPNLTYRAGATVSGTDTFKYVARDAAGAVSVAATVTINIGAATTSTTTALSRLPVLSATTVTVPEDGSVPIVLGSASLDGIALTYTVTSGPANGVLSGTVPNLTYRPNANFVGTDGVSFTISDGTLASVSGTISITVTPVNDPPTATPAALTVTEDGVLSILLQAGDLDGDSLTYSVVNGPTNGTLTGTAPALSYRPNANFNGTDRLTFTASDGVSTSVVATVSIAVTPVNDPPIAIPPVVSLPENGSVSVVLGGQDPDGGALTYTVVSGPSRGVLTGTAPNLVYRPNVNVSGTDTFTYTVGDGVTTSAVATVAITVTPVNHPPVAIAPVVSLPEDGSVAVVLGGQDPDGGALTYTVVSGPSRGVLTGTAPNLVYRPNANFNGTDSFTYTVGDGTATSAVATVAITVTPVNDPPVAIPPVVSLPEDGSVAVVLGGQDPDGDALTFRVVGGPSRGVLTGTAPNLVYRPNANFNGTDSLTYTVGDGVATSTAATVTITVTPVNDAPVAISPVVSLPEDGSVAVVLSGQDPDGDVLAYTVVSGPSNGVLTGTAPNLVYIPNPNFNGADSFAFTVGDGVSTSAAATVAVTVTPVNDVPVAVGTPSFATPQGACTPLRLGGSDADGDSLTYVITAPPTKGVLSGTAPDLCYTPNAGASGTDSFTYVVRDGAATSTPVTVGIEIPSVNGVPIAEGGSVQVVTGASVAVLLKGSDPDGQSLAYAVVAAPTKGVLSGTAPNLRYTPAAGYTGPDEFAFTVSDGMATSPAAKVSITVAAPNRAPVAKYALLMMNEDSPAAVVLYGQDADGDALTFTVVKQPANGTLSGTAPYLRYTPRANFNGSDSLTYTVSDGKATSTVTPVYFYVVAVNDAPVATPAEVRVSPDVGSTIILSGADPDGTGVYYTLASDPAHGTLVGTPPWLTYTPEPGYKGSDSFTFTVRDLQGVTSAPAQVSITVSDSQSASTIVVADSGTATVLRDGSVALLSADRSRAAALRRAPRHGTLDLRSDGTFAYAHDGDGSLEDSFSVGAEGDGVAGDETEIRVEVFGLVDVRREADRAVSVEFSVLAGLHYRVESREVDGSWQSLANFAADADGNATVTFRGEDSTSTRYFRAVCVGTDGDLFTGVRELPGVPVDGAVR